MGKFDASKVLVTEAEVDAAYYSWQRSAPARPSISRIIAERNRIRWNIALGKAIGVYGLEHDRDQLTKSQRKGAA